MNFNNLNRNGDKNNIPDEKEFLEMLLKMVNRDNLHNDFSIGIVEFITQLQIIMRDEFNGEVNIIGLNTLAIQFPKGEQFTIRVEKGISIFPFI